MNENMESHRELELHRGRLDAKKENKKWKRKQKKQTKKELQAATMIISRVLDRSERIEDMNLRSFMILDKVSLLLDTAFGIMDVVKGFPKNERDEIKLQISRLNSELSNIMNWVGDNRETTSNERDIVSPVSSHTFDGDH